jgi:hypothetical protein
MRIAYILSLLVIMAAVAGCATQEITTADERVIKPTSMKTTPVEQEEPAAETETAPAKTTTKATPPPATSTEMTFEQEEAKAVEAAKEFVKSLDGYKLQQGRELQVLNAAKTGCEGCWVVDLSFTRDLLYYPDKIEYIKVHVALKNWKMDTYTFR